MKPSRFSFAVLSVACWSFVPALAAGAASSKASKKSDSFPTYFRPLSWDLDSKKAKTLFPRSTVTTSKVPVLINGQRQEMTLLSVEGHQWKYLGKAPVEIFFDSGGKVHHVAVQALGTRRIDKSHYKKLAGVYGQLKKYFTSQYGKPKEDAVVSEDKQKFNPLSAKWSTQNFSLLLFVLGDEKGYWAVNVLVQHP